MTRGWNLWVWLECIGVVSGCCCKEVYRRYPHNNYYFSLLHVYYIALFLAAASKFLCSLTLGAHAQQGLLTLGAHTMFSRNCPLLR